MAPVRLRRAGGRFRQREQYSPGKRNAPRSGMPPQTRAATLERLRLARADFSGGAKPGGDRGKTWRTKVRRERERTRAQDRHDSGGAKPALA
jgi:hypothetical protein